ncbi:phosphoribosyl-ATP pyrophosphohydrolase [Bacillaceae bacterium JMAK1]|nr:phosphoribosyl-ATP pyrophosphohydrolase [Bacillaceae bacterium JMAK1]
MPKYHKLVRDRIPEIIERQGLSYSSRKLSEEEYIMKLREKLNEEIEEYDGAASDEEAVEELSDVLEVLYALAAFHGSSIKSIEANRAKKFKERGGFLDRILLEEVEDD